MKDDYLWDKTGDDADIAALENALRAFRQRETGPPPLPARELAPEPARPRRFFGFGFAFAAAFAALVVVFFLVRRPAPDRPLPAGVDVADANLKKRPEKTDGTGFVEPPVRANEPQAPAARPLVIKTRQPAAPETRRTKTVWRTNNSNNLNERPAPALTAEEKYAYDQLRLALSITGSQLRIVKDKISAIEDSTAAVTKSK